MNLVYIAGPYRAADVTAVRANINAAKRTGVYLISMLHAHVTCCQETEEEMAQLANGDYNREELFGIGGKKSCPDCFGKKAEWFPVIPHMNTALFDFHSEIMDIVPDSYYLQGTLEQMRGCKAVILTKREAIHQSVGTTSEVMEANRLGIPVFTSVEAFIHYLTDENYRKMVEAQVIKTVALAAVPAYDEAVTFGLS